LLEQCAHAFTQLPSAILIEQRNPVVFALLMLTGARDGAFTPLRLKQGEIDQGVGMLSGFHIVKHPPLCHFAGKCI
jgi:hypothetical protein